jgi:hypothetical protein
MKLLSRLFFALVICVIGIALILSPVLAYSWRIYIDNSREDEGYVGDTIGIDGSWAYTHGDDLYLYFEIDEDDEDDWPNEEYKNTGDDVEVTPGPPPEYEYEFDRDDIQFTIPECYSGEHEIWLCDEDDPEQEVDTVTFTVYPFIEIDEDEGPAGTEVAMSGFGWHKKDSDFEIWFMLDTGEPSSATLADLDEGTDYVVAWSADDAGTDVEIDDDIEHQGTWKAEITLSIPEASQGEHWVYAVGDENDDIADYKIKGAPFEVTAGISSDVKSGVPGTEVTVSGSGFVSEEEGIEIFFDGDKIVNAFTADEDGCWEKTFKIPTAGAGIYTITVEGDDTDESDLDELKFEIKSTLSMTPTEGDIGTLINISGTGLPGNTTVTVSYDGATAKSGSTDANGNLPTISFPATHTQSTHQASHTVVVSYGSTSKSYTFTMESTAPAVPALKSPADAVRLSFVKKVTPELEWSAVTDPSGVSYELQLAKNPEFMPVLISKSGLSGTSYTLTEVEALSYGSYYWRVTAIDGAMNDSGWSATSSFKSGLLPLWAFITIIALLVVLLSFLVFILVRRSRDIYD